MSLSLMLSYVDITKYIFNFKAKKTIIKGGYIKIEY